MLEQVVAIGLLGILLCMVAAQVVQTGRGGKAGRHAYEGSTIAQNLLETNQAKSVTLLDMGLWDPVTGSFSDATPYSAQIEVYSMNGSGPAAGLSDDEIRGMRVTVSWQDSNGSHQARSEGVLVKMAR
jgi:hypothetical protein